jgi:hypothetical protein
MGKRAQRRREARDTRKVERAHPNPLVVSDRLLAAVLYSKGSLPNRADRRSQ